MKLSLPLRESTPARKSYKKCRNGGSVTVYHPSFLSLSSRNFGVLNTGVLTHFFFEKACFSIIKKLHKKVDAVYGHFLYPAGAVAVKIGSKVGVPSFVAVGESSFWGVEVMGLKKSLIDFKDLKGVVAVSTLLKKNIVNEIEIPSNKIKVFPNGVNLNNFFPHDRNEMRSKFNLPQKDFIISFVGHFDSRKGPLRVLEAMKGLKGVSGVFIGTGPQKPIGSQVSFSGAVSHESIPEILSASDIFVLPTQAEGSCNAIIEAIACGIPVITSNGEFNDDITDEGTCLRVDPMNISQIRVAIQRLKENAALRSEMSENCLKKAKKFNIRIRAKKIYEMIVSD